MKPQELRIGNEIRYKGYMEHIVTKDTFSKDDGFFNRLSGIHITPEWLDGRGLRYLQNACWELGSYRIYNVSGDRPRFRITIAGHEIAIVSYVHQLQNLYFDLTGKEL